MFPPDYNNPVCVFCGSSPGSTALFTTSAQAVGAALAAERIPMIYGGGRRGLMGTVSQGALEAGGLVHGVLPRALMSRAAESTPAPLSGGASLDVSGRGTPAAAGGVAASAEGEGSDLLSDNYGGRLTMEVVGSMHERKAKMAHLSTGGFVVLPGGYGTFEELLEMVTWNQIGMHSLPVVVLNIHNFYAPLKALLESSVAAGFIKPENLSLVQIVDIGDAAANADEARAADWGAAAVAALRNWATHEAAGYGFNWEDVKYGAGAKDGGPKAVAVAPSPLAPTPGSPFPPTLGSPMPPTPGPSASASAEQAPPRDPMHPALASVGLPRMWGQKPPLLSTGRYVSAGGPVTPANIPLWDYHLQRLKGAHAHFAARDRSWGAWPGDEAIWEQIRVPIEQQGGAGDWRLRMVITPENVIVQVLPEEGMPPFAPLPTDTLPRRRVVLDPVPTTVDPAEAPYRLFKTEYRQPYLDASRRVDDTTEQPDGTTIGSKPEVLMHDGRLLLETATANIAIRKPSATSQGGWDWVTPRLERTPFLTGTMRRFLFEKGVLREGSLTVEDWHRAQREGWRVIGFNAFWGVWEADIGHAGR